jgi:histone H3/H4
MVERIAQDITERNQHLAPCEFSFEAIGLLQSAAENGLVRSFRNANDIATRMCKRRMVTAEDLSQASVCLLNAGYASNWAWF